MFKAKLLRCYDGRVVFSFRSLETTCRQRLDQHFVPKVDD